jgi:hypothetical protein
VNSKLEILEEVGYLSELSLEVGTETARQGSSGVAEEDNLKGKDKPAVVVHACNLSTQGAETL